MDSAKVRTLAGVCLAALKRILKVFSFFLKTVFVRVDTQFASMINLNLVVSSLDRRSLRCYQLIYIFCVLLHFRRVNEKEVFRLSVQLKLSTEFTLWRGQESGLAPVCQGLSCSGG